MEPTHLRVCKHDTVGVFVLAVRAQSCWVSFITLFDQSELFFLFLSGDVASSVCNKLAMLFLHDEERVSRGKSGCHD